MITCFPKCKYGRYRLKAGEISQRVPGSISVGRIFLYLTLNAIDFYGDYRDISEGEWGNFHVKLRGPK